MKFFLAVALIASVASAAIVPLPAAVGSEQAEIMEIIAAINSPSTDPATAAALEQMLLDVLGVSPIAVGPAIVDQAPISVGPAIVDQSPISVGPAIVDQSPISVGPAIIESNPIAVGPVIVDFPLPDAGVVSEESLVQPSPVVVAPAPTPAVEAEAISAPLVQIILNINQAGSPAAVVATPVGVAAPEPVIVVDSAEVPAEPVQVIEAVPEPIQVIEAVPEPIQVIEAVPEPIQVIEAVPEPIQVIEAVPEPVIIGNPIIPSPAVVLPENLN